MVKLIFFAFKNTQVITYQTSAKQEENGSIQLQNLTGEGVSFGSIVSTLSFNVFVCTGMQLLRGVFL